MGVLLANRARSTLAAGLADTDLSLTVQAGHATRFPQPVQPDDWFPLLLVKANGSYEIVKATARAGAVITIERGQEGTAALTFDAGDGVALIMSVASIAKIDHGHVIDDVSGLQDELDLKADAAALGSAAAADLGTSGATVPRLNGANLWSATQLIKSAGNAVCLGLEQDDKADGWQLLPDHNGGALRFGRYQGSTGMGTTWRAHLEADGKFRAAILQAESGVTNVRALAGQDASLNLQDEAGATQGVMYWSRLGAFLGLSKFNAGQGRAVMGVGNDNVELNPTAQGQLNLRGQRLPLQGYYQSPDIGIGPGTTFNVAHGLGAQPTLVQLWLKCIAADSGYGTGDMVVSGGFNTDVSGSTVFSRGSTVSLPNTTHIEVTTGIHGVGLPIKNNGGPAVNMVLSSWRYVVRAWR